MPFWHNLLFFHQAWKPVSVRNTKLRGRGNTIASKSSTSQLSISTVWALKLPWGQWIQGVSTNQRCRAPQWQSYPCWHTAPTTDLFKQLERLALPASGDLQGHWQKGWEEGRGGRGEGRGMGGMAAGLGEGIHSSAIGGHCAEMAPSRN